MDAARHATRPSRRSHLRAVLWIAAGFGAVALPFFVLLNTGALMLGNGWLWDFSKGLGFAALALIGLQFILTARFRRLALPFGVDIVYLFHRYLAIGAVALMLGHFGILYIWYQDVLGELNPLTARWELTAGRLALVCFAALVITSEFRKRLALPYAGWRYVHVALALVGFVAAISHILGVGHFTAALQSRTLWLAVTMFWLALIVWVRLVKPWRQTTNPWLVAATQQRHGGAVTLTLEPQGKPLADWKPGQFAWLTLDRSPFRLSEHPFTISSPPGGAPRVEMTIKPLGNFSAAATQTRPGTIAYLDGPYGIFSIDGKPGAEGFVMIAGGIGITPMIANLEAMRERGDARPVILFYANPSWHEIAFRDELDGLQAALALKVVHVLEKPGGDFEGETGFIDRDMLARHLDAPTRKWAHLLCGPPAMTANVKQALLDLGVPLSDIESELFDMV